ncbi:hypothetical protein TNCV_4180201 [Trichonephila clavipes]|nr:hypothetical protein TNCV_4180201 [Trichonephila clavipes]
MLAIIRYLDHWVTAACCISVEQWITRWTYSPKVVESVERNPFQDLLDVHRPLGVSVSTNGYLSELSSQESPRDLAPRLFIFI